MTTYTLTVLDTPHIQPYIFGSNRLRENIGASELVRRATTTWCLDVLRARERSNVRQTSGTAIGPPAARLSDLRIERDNLTAEVLYVGGGNALLLFADAERARGFVTALHRTLIQEAPGLHLAAAHVAVDWDHDDLQAKVAEAMLRLREHKQSRPLRSPLLGQAVTVEGRSTGGVASTTNAAHGKPAEEATFPIATAVAAKLEALPAAQQRLRALASDAFRRTPYQFPHSFEHLGRSKHEMSYIAVVHADGNNMGQFFRRVAEEAEGARAYILKMRDASHQVERASRAALQRLEEALLNAITYDDEGGSPQVQGVVPLSGDYVPFRPLVFGGDDVTFVCDGRLGLGLAARYLALFEEETARLGLNLHACAGVAVAKSHYPFARVYELSEALAKRAKRYVQAHGADIDRADFSALDWHFAASGILGGVQKIREREYTVSLDARGEVTGTLCLRPLSLGINEAWRGWEAFARVVTAFQGRWGDQRNKVLALREVLRAGPEAVREYLTAVEQDLPPLDLTKRALQNTGWFGKTCGYFDAIEALDFYVPL